MPKSSEKKSGNKRSDDSDNVSLDSVTTGPKTLKQLLLDRTDSLRSNQEDEKAAPPTRPDTPTPGVKGDIELTLDVDTDSGGETVEVREDGGLQFVQRRTYSQNALDQARAVARRYQEQMDAEDYAMQEAAAQAEAAAAAEIDLYCHETIEWRDSPYTDDQFMAASACFMEPCENVEYREHVPDNEGCRGPHPYSDEVEPPRKKLRVAKPKTFATKLADMMRGQKDKGGPAGNTLAPHAPRPFSRKTSSIWSPDDKRYMNVFMGKCDCRPCVLRWHAFGWWKDMAGNAIRDGTSTNKSINMFLE